MKYVYVTRPGMTSLQELTITSEADPSRKYTFQLNGDAVAVHKDDEEQVNAHAHIEPEGTAEAEAKAVAKAQKEQEKDSKK